MIRVTDGKSAFPPRACCRSFKSRGYSSQGFLPNHLPEQKETYRVAVMENDFVEPTEAEATNALASISDDRRRLADDVQVPWALLMALGGMGAWWVASAADTNPGENYESSSSGWLALVGALIIIHLIKRELGVQFRGLGARGVWALVGLVSVCSVLFSVSLGLVSLDLRWAVALTSLAAFAATTWFAKVAYQSAIEKLRRG